MLEKKDKLNLPPPSKSIRPAFVIAGNQIPVLKDLITWHLEKERAKRDDDVQAFCEEISARVDEIYLKLNILNNKVDSKVDVNHFYSEEFFRKFHAAANEYLIEQDETKRRYLIDFVSYYSLSKRPDVTLMQIFWNIVKELNGCHLVILSEIYSAQKKLSSVDLINLSPGRSEAISIKSLSNILDLEHGLLSLLINTLITKGLIRKIPGPPFGTDKSERLIIEDVGMRFMRYLNSEWQ